MTETRWTFAAFEQLTKEQDLKPKQKMRIDGLDVMWAEGSRRPDHNMDTPHWCLVYAVGLGEYMDTAQCVWVPQYIKMDSGIELPLNKKDRKDFIKRTAKQWIANNKQAKRY